jgi:Holliday junction resolvase RusA-like endonuclease
MALKRVLHLTVRGLIPSKKNSRVSAGRFTVASPKYRDWETDACLQILNYKGADLSLVDVQLEFWMPNNVQRDLDNMVTSVFDMLQAAGVIRGDHWQCLPSFYARAGGIDKINPRVEIWLKEL